MSCAPGTGLRIVVIDSDADYADDLGRWLQVHRHEVRVQYVLDRGLREVRKFAPDLVVVDPRGFATEPVRLLARLDAQAGEGRVVALADELTVGELDAWFLAGAIARLRKADAIRSLWRFSDRRGLEHAPRLYAL